MIAASSFGERGMPPGALIIVGSALVGAAILIILIRRGQGRVNAPRPGVFAREEGDRAREELARILSDIQDLSREQIARLDTKLRMLQQLIIDADKRIAELKSLTGRTGGSAAPAPQTRPANPLHDKVFALADSGKSIDAICVETGLEKGEVDLVLGLRNVH